MEHNMKPYIPLLLFTIFIFPCFPQENSIPDRAEYKQVLEGFDSGKSISGDWIFTGKAIAQNNSLLPHAKYSIQLEQKNSNYLYSCTAQATGIGRIGYGLHLFAGNSGPGDLYGFGNSLLFWVTRDNGHYGNPGTYVQLYRSYSDANMIEIGSVLVAEQITDELKIEAYVNIDLGIISVSVNGDLKLFAPVRNFNFDGKSITLRTLNGPVIFTDLEVMEKK